MRQFFVLVEITDPTVNAFLWHVRHILTGSRRRRFTIHITLRGPYEDENAREQAVALADLHGDVLGISGIGRFSNPGDEVVYFKVNSPHLRSASWKRDFPVGRYGFEPHISVYRGNDPTFANIIAEFLSNQNIQLNCAEYQLIWHEVAQPNLFSVREPSVGELSALFESSRVDVSVLDGLREIVDRYRAKQPRRLAGGR